MYTKRVRKSVHNRLFTRIAKKKKHVQITSGVLFDIRKTVNAYNNNAIL